MGLEIFNSLKLGAIKPNISVSHQRSINFTSAPSDTVEIKSLDRFTSETAIRNMIEKNPKIKAITSDFNPQLTLNMKELQELLNTHAKDTQNISNEIFDNLTPALQNKINKQSLNDAAYLHDLGKVLIPENILNKPAKLTPEEYKIMDVHSDLSYELLKNSGLSDETLELIKNHHMKPKGLKAIIQNSQPSLALQILSTADKYSALTEKRIYKDALTPQEALTIIYRDVENGKLNPQIFFALAKAKTGTNQISHLKT